MTVKTETEMERRAYELNEKKMFHSGVYFNNVSRVTDREYSYKICMDVDNIPVTIENRNRYWLPGPSANFQLDMKYHRGFIQLQHSLDQAIIKTIRYHETVRLNKERDEMTTVMADYDYSTDNLAENNTTEITVVKSTTTSPPTDNDSGTRNINKTAVNVQTFEGVSTDLNSDNSSTTTTLPPVASESGTKRNMNITVVNVQTFEGVSSVHENERRDRKKRSDLDILDFDFDDSSEKEPEPEPEEFHVDEMEVYTKQFPYPKYRKDTYVAWLYRAQAIQMAFFFAMIIQVSVSVRQRIWTKESGNSTVINLAFFG